MASRLLNLRKSVRKGLSRTDQVLLGARSSVWSSQKRLMLLQFFPPEGGLATLMNALNLTPAVTHPNASLIRLACSRALVSSLRWCSALNVPFVFPTGLHALYAEWRQPSPFSSVRRALSYSSCTKVECKQTLILQGAAEI